jgi:hypothetical protein
MVEIGPPGQYAPKVDKEIYKRHMSHDQWVQSVYRFAIINAAKTIANMPKGNFNGS